MNVNVKKKQQLWKKYRQGQITFETYKIAEKSAKREIQHAKKNFEHMIALTEFLSATAYKNLWEPLHDKKLSYIPALSEESSLQYLSEKTGIKNYFPC